MYVQIVMAEILIAYRSVLGRVEQVLPMNVKESSVALGAVVENLVVHIALPLVARQSWNESIALYE